MIILFWLAVLAVGCLTIPAEAAWPKNRRKVDCLNLHLAGLVVDCTHNHGADRRIWSESLGQYRDLYVYLPPGFDQAKQYPLGFLLHGATQDEQLFLEVVHLFDRAIVEGELPPVILAGPDGSVLGRPSLSKPTTIFINSRVGNFEDYLLKDVWNFMTENFPIRPEREAHALLGVSMGGMAAYTHAIKNKDRFKIVVGFFPAVNMRWVNCRSHYRGAFDPWCWSWRTGFKPFEVFGRTTVPIHFRGLLEPLFGWGPHVIDELSAINPIELMDFLDLKEGDLSMYIAYGGKDKFKIDAQVESFVHRAKERGLTIGLGYDPQGKHDIRTGIRLLPEAFRWVAPLVAPYAPK